MIASRRCVVCTMTFTIINGPTRYELLQFNTKHARNNTHQIEPRILSPSLSLHTRDQPNKYFSSSNQIFQSKNMDTS